MSQPGIHREQRVAAGRESEGNAQARLGRLQDRQTKDSPLQTAHTSGGSGDPSQHQAAVNVKVCY